MKNFVHWLVFRSKKVIQSLKELKSDLRANLRPKSISLKLNKAYSKSCIGLKYIVWAEKTSMRDNKGCIKNRIKLSPELIAFL